MGDLEEPKMTNMPKQLVELFKMAVASMDDRFGSDLGDDSVEAELHKWLDGDDPLPWKDPLHVTADEWFFITTLYGEMTLDGQRTHIRRFFRPLFVEAARRDVTNFVPELPEYKGLRSAWMKGRLCRMGQVLRDRGMSMSAYVEHLHALESGATPENPMPALDAIVRDHRATGWKTLSVFVRDCVLGNCFPIDSRAEAELRSHGLCPDERLLVSLSLSLGRNPRQVARMFYAAGGQ